MIISGADQTTQNSGLSTQMLSYEDLFARLQSGHTLITGNSRLSRVLTGQYNQWRMNQGDLQWQSPDVISWNLWLDQLWETAGLQGITGTDRAVPGNRQLISLWEHTLKYEPLEHKLLRPESLATQLRDTRRLIAEWQLDMNDPAWFASENENHSSFHQWNRAFEKRCKKAGWISPEDRPALLSKAIGDGSLPTPQSIDLLGFDEFSPARADLLSVLIETGNKVCRLTITPRQDKASLWKCKDSKDELQQMARWARHWYEKEPDSDIAIVVPDLQSRRQVVERQLQEILNPGRDASNRQAKPWNISMGVPLARIPMIEAAFEIFRLLDKRIDIQDIGRVLRSPWLRGANSERNQRALLEKCLRDSYPRQIKPAELRYRSGEIKTHDRQGNELPESQHEPQPWNSPELSIALNSLARFDADSKGLRPASTWAEYFDRLLVGLGWPLAEENPEEHDYNWQALQSWRDGLRELASLDATTPKIGRNAAINQLKQICREIIFQPKTNTAPIQVLGLYEISGLRFDHLWVVGLHNDTWPPSAKPNPFIPAGLQRASQLPNSSPQRELEVARTITQRLLETAADCVFSFPGQLDGEDLMPSPLLERDEIEQQSTPPFWQGESWQSVVAGAQAPQLVPLVMPGKLEYGTARGGSSILKHQALCPFRAFASNRLGADGLETPVDGISPMLHGSLVHSVLEYFWTETKTQANLLSLDDEALCARVRKHVDFVTSEERGLKQRPAFRDVEAMRVHRHVMDYLALEKQREAFEVVGFEKEILPEIEGQSIRLIIDRVDKLPSGEEIIIDYKTGKVEPQKWFGDRPEDPQLPLYAISAEETPAAVVFGIIRDDGCLYKGVVKQPGLLPDLPPKATKANEYLIEAGYKMQETITDWRQVLHHLMADFLAGKAAIDPKLGTISCDKSYCELQSLCRIGELEKHRDFALKTGTREDSA
jgi:ATP-dependent helicase/nuclease subunit B